jgi:hypothetical protein
MTAERLDDTREAAISPAANPRVSPTAYPDGPRPADDPRPPAHDAAPVVAPTAVRQGKADNRVRYILGIGIALVAIAFIVVYFVTPTPPTP